VYRNGQGTQVITIAPGSMLTLKATCCFVQDGSWRALVDPGSFQSLEEIDLAMQPFGLSLQDVNAVYYTHLHFDHYRYFDWPGHVETILMPRIEWEYVNALREVANDEKDYLEFLKKGHAFIAPIFLRQFWRFAKDKRYDFTLPELKSRLCLVEAGVSLSPNVITVSLPGHCPQLLALWVQTELGKEIICADAVLDEEDFFHKRERLIIHDRETESVSREILQNADILHPGHGTAFHAKSWTEIPELTERAV
jgi:glyoxylase-like metal-dependent hydrolase (beta-lactamase superfamily II)